jgi:hypothetical protein
VICSTINNCVPLPYLTFPQFALFLLIAGIAAYFVAPYGARFAKWVSAQNNWVASGILAAMLALGVGIYLFAPLLLFVGK